MLNIIDSFVKLAFIATIGVLFIACGSKTDVDFSIVPVKGPNGEYQYVDPSQKGKIIINPQFGEAFIFRDGLALVKTSGRDGKYGYIDKKGKYVISPTYDYAQDFGEGVAWVQMEDQPPMLIDRKGKMLLQIDSLVKAYPFHGGMATINYYNSEGQTYGMFINKKGEAAVTTTGGKFSSIINDGLYAFQSKGSEKWGYKNKKGETVINEQFDGAETFFEEVAVVKVGNKRGSINKKGDFIVNPQYDVLSYDSDGLYIVKVGKKYGWISKKGEIVINPQFDDCWPFYGNKLAPVRMGSKWAYVDKKGQTVINPQFDFALPFFGDYAAIANRDGLILKIGFINKKGDIVVLPLYNAGKDDFKEYAYSVGQKKFGLPIWYYFELGNDEKFLPYDKLKEKMKAYQEAKWEKTRQEFEEARADAMRAQGSNSSPRVKARNGDKPREHGMVDYDDSNSKPRKKQGAGGRPRGTAQPLTEADWRDIYNGPDPKVIKAPSSRDIVMDSDASRTMPEIMTVVNARMPGLRRTYNGYVKDNPDLKGKVTLKLTIAPGGNIISISIVSSTTGNSKFDNAIKDVVATWRWKAITSGNTTTTIPFNFE